MPGKEPYFHFPIDRPYQEETDIGVKLLTWLSCKLFYNSNVKGLLSSGYSIECQANKILKRGCNGFIQKPFTMKQLSVIKWVSLGIHNRFCYSNEEI